MGIGITKIGVAAAIVAAGALFDPAPAPSSPGIALAASSDSRCYRFTDNERALFKKINSERARRGLVAYRLDPEMSRVASAHNAQQIKRKTIFHNTQANGDRLVGWSLIGENVGVGASVETQHSTYMASDSHRSNILEPTFRFVGLATKVGSDGRLYTTQLFERTKNPGTTLRMPRC